MVKRESGSPYTYQVFYTDFTGDEDCFMTGIVSYAEAERIGKALIDNAFVEKYRVDRD